MLFIAVIRKSQLALRIAKRMLHELPLLAVSRHLILVGLSIGTFNIFLLGSILIPFKTMISLNK